MTSEITQHSIFKLRPSKAETKADITNEAARTITGAEAERRAIKTARLRQARLEAEAMRPASPAQTKKRRAKRVVARGGRPC